MFDAEVFSVYTMSSETRNANGTRSRTNTNATKCDRSQHVESELFATRTQQYSAEKFRQIHAQKVF